MVPAREHPGEIMLETKPPIAAADLCDCWASDLKSAKHKLVSIAFRDSRSYNSEQIAKSLQIVHNEVAEEAEGPGSAYRWRLTWKIRGSWSLSVCISRYRAEQYCAMSCLLRQPSGRMSGLCWSLLGSERLAGAQSRLAEFD